MIMMRHIVLLVTIILTANAADILILIPFTSTSHYVFLRPIGLELANRGHNVTVITSHKEDNPPSNYTEVVTDDIKIWDSVDGGRPNVFTMVDQSFESFYDVILFKGGLFTTENVLKSRNVKEFMNKDNKFDLVISELFFQESLYMFAHKYNAPLVLMSTFGNCMRGNVLMRNPLQLATAIEEFGFIRNPRSFWGRLTNLYYSFYELFVWKYSYMPQHEHLVQKYFKDLPKPVPSLEDLHRNASLTLYNGHFSIDTPIAYLPNIIEVGGMHLFRSEKKLPEDLQKVLDDAIYGVVYVNLGTNVRSSELPKEKRDAFISVFRSLKQTILWKWEDKEFDDKPPNIVIRDWMPQQEILAHPNIKVFIAHGGLIGLEEATFHGVPLIGIPIYADQYNNLLQAEEHGYGRLLEYHDINEENLGKVLNDVLKDDTMINKAKEISLRYKDRPMSGLDTAIFWIEYVIRHKGADFMKNPALKLYWFEYHMIDVFLFIFVIAVVSILILLRMVRLICKMFTKTNIKEKKLQ